MATATVPCRSPSGQPSPSHPTRRALLAGAAAAPVLARPAVAVCGTAADAPDPHQAEAAAAPAVLLAHALALHDLLDVPGMSEGDAVRSLVEALVAGLRAAHRLALEQAGGALPPTS